MSDGEFKKKVFEWAKAIGRENVIGRMVGEKKYNSRTIERLCDNTYSSSPRGPLRQALIDEMAKDGFTLTDEKAS